MKVFISYNHNDSNFVDKLKKALEEKNIRVTIDVESLKFSGDIKEFINKSVKESDLTISVVSKNSLKSVWVIDEALTTLMHEEVNQKKKFMPVYIDKSFLDNKFTLEVIRKINIDINEILRITKEFIKEGSGTEHLDTQRERLNNAKSNLPKLLKKLLGKNVADFSIKEKFNENLPKLIEEIMEKGEGFKQNQNVDAYKQENGYEYDVYISYPRNKYQKPAVMKAIKPGLEATLIEKLSLTPRIFCDWEDIKYGGEFYSQLREGLSRSKLLVAILSKQYFSDDRCLKEMSVMFHREEEKEIKDELVFLFSIKDCEIDDLLKNFPEKKEILEKIKKRPMCNLKNAVRIHKNNETSVFDEMITSVHFSKEPDELTVSIKRLIENPPLWNKKWSTNEWLEEAIQNYMEKLKFPEEVAGNPPNIGGELR